MSLMKKQELRLRMHVYSIKKFQNISNENGAGELSPALFLKLQKIFYKKVLTFFLKYVIIKTRKRKQKREVKKRCWYLITGNASLLLSRRKKITTFSIFATKKISKKEDISVWQELDTKERDGAPPFSFSSKKTFVRLSGRWLVVTNLKNF